MGDKDMWNTAFAKYTSEYFQKEKPGDPHWTCLYVCHCRESQVSNKDVPSWHICGRCGGVYGERRTDGI